MNEETVARFDAFVTFFHEAVHFAQYVSSSFGLRVLRRTLIALRYLAERPGWDLPVGASLLARMDALSDYEMKATLRFLAFLEAEDQLRLHVDAYDDPRSDAVDLTWSPWSAYFFILPAEDPSARLALASDLEAAGVLIHRLPHIVARRSGRTEEAVVNAALLMENFAFLAEVNQVYNAAGMHADSLTELLDLVPSGHGYTAAMNYALGLGASDRPSLLPTLAVCIDVALMYDPFVLHDAPSIERPAPGQHADRLPGETFVDACNAAMSIGPIDNYGDVARFYVDLCETMGLPSPEWMAEQACTVAERLLSQQDDQTTAWLGAAVELHAEGLRERLKRPATFCFELLSSDALFDVIDRCAAHISFFDLRSRQPQSFKARDVDLLTLHNLIVQSLVEERLACPLKHGDPFYCENALADENTLCVWSDGECQLDIFERRCGLRPSIGGSRVPLEGD